MRQGISISAAGPGGDPRSMAQMAADAEEAGWDAVFLEDYIVYPGTPALATYDPWLVLAAMAVATRRIRLGTLVTPITPRRPWKRPPWIICPAAASSWASAPERRPRPVLPLSVRLSARSGGEAG
jgi:hypothetical protein